MAIYYFLKFVVWVALQIFFRKFQVHNRRFLQTPAPLMVVGNHPNTFMDPLIAAVLVPKRVAFIANGSIFNKFTRPIFDFFHVIPVYRAKDMPNADNSLSQTVLNKQTFERCYDYLADNGKILIFPEGTSELERKIRQIKTGTARIAFGAEEEHDFKLGTKILPVGLNYSDPTRFRSDVFVNVSEPIAVKDFEVLYKENPTEAVEKLTDLIEKAFLETTIATDDAEEDLLIHKIEILFKNELFESLRMNDESKKDDFILVRKIIAWVRSLEQNSPKKYEELKNGIESYFDSLQKLGLSDDDFVDSRQLYGHFVGKLLQLILGFPIYLFGLINNYIPYILPLKIFRLITKDLTYKAPIMMSVGVLVFPIFYGLQIWAVQHFLTTSCFTALYAIALPLTGFYVIRYWGLLRQMFDAWRGLRIRIKQPKIHKKLNEERNQLLATLSALG